MKYVATGEIVVLQPTNQQKKHFPAHSSSLGLAACCDKTKNNTNTLKTYEIKSRNLRQKLSHTMLPMTHFADGIRNFAGTLTQKNKTTIFHYIYDTKGFHTLFKRENIKQSKTTELPKKNT